MFNEFSNVTQSKGSSGFRRWFCHKTMDLVVWHDEAGSISGFQLIYDKDWNPRAFTWTGRYGYLHAKVDEGDDGWTPRSPILVPDGILPYEALLGSFKELARSLEPHISNLVELRMRDYAEARGLA
ncbi:MAG: hypothetical protein COB53_01560 [Elusimicrobia bacterium]|nr:MAG: hypothetical protein COB53_01560 [Elusimicrobiota bacterium]